jgi:hypothetical protein
MHSKIDIKYIIIFSTIIAVAILAHNYKRELFICTENILSNIALQNALGLISFAASVVSKIKHKKISFSNKMAFSQFKIPIEEILSFISNPISIMCSISLARGLFTQLIAHKQTIFNGFSALELTFITLVVFYLLYDGFIDLIYNCKLVFLKTSSLTAIPEGAVKETAS